MQPSRLCPALPASLWPVTGGSLEGNTMNTTNETPDESVDRLRELLADRLEVERHETPGSHTSAWSDIHGMASFNKTSPTNTTNLEPLEDKDGNAFRGLFFAVLLLSMFASGVALGVAILYLLTR